ncbi:MAG: hypothetical protein ACJ8EL_14995 [Rhizomicrobium sp.]
MMSRPNSSHDLPKPAVRKERERDLREAVIEDADKTDIADRDLEHGDGGTLGVPTKPSDLSHDD